MYFCIFLRFQYSENETSRWQAVIHNPKIVPPRVPPPSYAEVSIIVVTHIVKGFTVVSPQHTSKHFNPEHLS